MSKELQPHFRLVFVEVLYMLRMVEIAGRLFVEEHRPVSPSGGGRSGA